MLRATADPVLPTTITGSLPRPRGYTDDTGLKKEAECIAADPNLTLLNVTKK